MKVVLKDGTSFQINDYVYDSSFNRTGLEFLGGPAKAPEVLEIINTTDISDAVVKSDDDLAIIADLSELDFTGDLHVTADKVVAILDTRYFTITKNQKQYIDAARILMGEV